MSDDDRGSGCEPDQGNSSKRQKTTPDASPAALLSHVIGPGANRGASRGASRGANGGTSRGSTRGANQGASRGAGGLANRGVRIRGGGRGTSKRAESQLASQSAKNKADENLARRGSFQPPPQFIVPQTANGQFLSLQNMYGEYIPIPLIPSIQRPNNFVALRNLPAATSENFAPSSLSPDLNNRIADNSEVSTGLLNTPSSDTSAIPSYPVATMTSEVFIDSVPPLDSLDDLNQSHVGAQSQNGSETDPLGSNQENLDDCHVNSDGIGTIAVSEEVIDSDQQINSEIADEDSVADTEIISSEKDDKRDERSIFDLPPVSGLQGPSGMIVHSNIQQPLSVQPASNIQSVSGTDIQKMKATLQAILNGVAENTRRIARLQEVAFDQPSGQVGVAPVEKPKKSLSPALPVRKKHHLREQLSQALENSVEMQEQFIFLSVEELPMNILCNQPSATGCEGLVPDIIHL
ncbi:hypothetical protein QAD02_011635 [Eretmocerus hayati]|uniref:Uncharacterized protein n=1 Tax=Eretmocerus hayati TaxID=131215 RepID=A0ACC2NX37_9HYME|nr:hypothetical protein QAD02_011635 [Eretmocerus hayati]